MKRKSIVKMVCIAGFIWFCILAADWICVNQFCRPLFCIVTGAGHYTGLGYAYDCAVHPITGRYEYALEIFGNAVVSTFTNGVM